MSPTGSWLRGSRGYATTVLVGLAAAGAATVGATKPWLRATATVDGMPRIVAEVSGTDLAPASAALGLACLAAFGAVVATRGWIRSAVGVLIAVLMLYVAVGAWFPGATSGAVEDALRAKGWAGGDSSVQSVWWRWLVAIATLLGAGCGSLVARFGPQWATMGDRYSPPSQNASPSLTHEADVWRAIDRGDDPTIDR